MGTCKTKKNLVLNRESYNMWICEVEWLKKQSDFEQKVASTNFYLSHISTLDCLFLPVCAFQPARICWKKLLKGIRVGKVADLTENEKSPSTGTSHSFDEKEHFRPWEFVLLKLEESRNSGTIWTTCTLETCAKKWKSTQHQITNCFSPSSVFFAIKSFFGRFIWFITALQIVCLMFFYQKTVFFQTNFLGLRRWLFCRTFFGQAVSLSWELVPIERFSQRICRHNIWSLFHLSAFVGKNLVHPDYNRQFFAAEN